MAQSDWLGLKRELPRGRRAALALLSFLAPLLLWAAVSETRNPDDLPQFVQELVKESVKALQKQGLAGGAR